MDEKHVVTCFLESEGRILLLRRSQKVGTYRGRWAGVSGYVEEGVTPAEQSLQEIREEAGLSAADVSLLASGEPVSVVDEGMGRRWVVHPFLYHVLQPDKLRIDWEHTETTWIDPTQIAEYETVPGLDRVWQSVARRDA